MREDLESKRDRWRMKFDQARKELWEVPNRIEPLKLYHYSSMAGIRGILSHKELWLSDILHMNDQRDGRYWIDVFRNLVSHKSVPWYVKDSFYKSKTFGLGEVWHEYIACFSEQSDLDRQWTEYADSGRGCAIEISFEALSKNADDGKAFAYMSMVYNRSQQIEMAEKIIDTAIHLARAEDLTSAEAKEFWINHAVWNFLVCGGRFKDPGYEQEQEWRVFKSRTDDRRDERYRKSPSGSEIPYLGLSLTPDMVTGLVKGPNCTVTDQDLCELLVSGGYAPHVMTVPIYCKTGQPLCSSL